MGSRLAHVPEPSPVPFPAGDVYASGLISRMLLREVSHAGGATAGCQGGAARVQIAPSVQLIEPQSGDTDPLIITDGALEKRTLSSSPLRVPTPSP